MTDLFSLLQFGPGGWGDEIASGCFVTISLALCTLPLGLAAGLALALAKRGDDPALRLSANLYTTIFRGLPELLTLFAVFYGGQALVNVLTRAAGLAPVTVSSFVAGMVALGFVFSAYASEVFLSAFRAIPPGQAEAGQALGLTRFGILRLITFPQLIRIALPGLSNVWLNLLKDTALVSTVQLSDLLRQSFVAGRNTFQPFFFLALACAIYLLMTFGSSLATGRIDRWARRGEVMR